MDGGKIQENHEKKLWYREVKSKLSQRGSAIQGEKQPLWKKLKTLIKGQLRYTYQFFGSERKEDIHDQFWLDLELLEN